MSQKITIVLFESFIAEKEQIEKQLAKLSSEVRLKVLHLDGLDIDNFVEKEADAVLINTVMLNADTLKIFKKLTKECSETTFLLVTDAENEDNTLEYCNKLDCDYILTDQLKRLPLWARQLLKHKKCISRTKKLLDKSRDSEAELQSILDAVPECIKLLDENCELMRINPAGMAILEVENEQELKEQPVVRFIEKSYRKNFEKHHKKALNGTCSKFEYRLTGQKGTERYLEANFSPLKDKEGHIFATLSVTRDITEQKIAESKLKQSEEKFRAIVENSYDAVGLYQPAEGFVYYSNKMNGILGFSDDEAIGFDYVHEEDKARFFRLLETARSNSRVAFKTEVRIRHRNGKITWTKFVFANHLDNKFVNAIVVNAHDITERIQSMQHIEDREKALRDVFSFAPVALLISRFVDGKILNANESVHHLVGVPYGALIGKYTTEFYYSKKNRERLKEMIAEDGKVDNLDVKIRHSSGEIIDILSSISIINYNNERVLLSSFINLTEKKRTELKLAISELTYKELFDKSPLGIITLSKEGVIDSVNEEVVRTSGYLKEDYLGRNILDLPYKMEILNFNKSELLREVLSGNFKIRFVESKITKRNGEFAYYDVRINYIPKIEKFILIVNDITAKKSMLEELHQSKTQLAAVASFNQILIDTIPLGIVSYNGITGACMSANPAICKIVGGSHEALMQTNFRELAMWRSSGLREIAETALRENKMYEIEFDGQSLFGSTVWLACRVIPFEQNGERHIMVFSEDISTRKEAEKELLKNQKLFKEISNAIPGVVYQSVMDREGRIQFTYINDGVGRIWDTKITPEEIYRDSSLAYEIIHPDDIRKMVESIPRDFDAPWAYEYRIITGSGAVRWMKSSANCRLQDDGSILRNGFIMDITDLKSYQEKILTREKQLREISASIPGAVYQFNVTGSTYRRYNYISKGIYTLCGITDEEIYENSATLLAQVHEDDREAVSAATTAVFKDLGTLLIVFRMINHQSGEVKWIRSHAIASKISFETVQLNGTLIDITEQVQSEKQKEQLLEDLNKKYNELMQFNYIVSHNLRAPVANIIGLADLLSKENNPVEREQIMEFLVSASNELDVTIRDLNLVLSARSSINEKYERVNLFELIDSIKNSLGLPLISQEDFIKLYIDEDAKTLFTIKAYFQSVLFNLINNAIKYKSSSRKLEIKIRAHVCNSVLTIEVQDNGIGMDMEKVGKKLFGLYQRFNYQTDGKGLGLFMVRTQLDTLGGTISVASQVNVGTTFTIQLKMPKIKVE
jgi:PAS domain S-box-containing protein